MFSKQLRELNSKEINCLESHLRKISYSLSPEGNDLK